MEMSPEAVRYEMDDEGFECDKSFETEGKSLFFYCPRGFERFRLTLISSFL
jgi:hypothetical protein